VDSADLSLIREFVGRGGLPNLAKLMRMGIVRILRSTIPDMTAPSWTSIFTGADPSTHGVYGFSQPSGHKIVRTGRTSCKATPIWDAINPLCQKVVVNVPNMHPVEPLNGCMISWISDGSDWVFPRDLLDDLHRFGYDRYAESHHSPLKRDVQWLCESIDTKSKVAAHVLEKYQWCLAAIVFSETDWAQHLFHYSKQKLLTVYSALDAALGRIVSTLGSRTPVIIISDHGYIESKKNFFINHWLINAGLLHHRASMRNRVLRTLMEIFERCAERSGEIRGTVGAVWRVVEKRVGHREGSDAIGPSSDLDRLEGLYCYGEDIGRYYRLYLTENSKMNYESFSQRLEDEVGKLRDIKENKNPIVKLFKKKDIYSGVHSLDAPDYVLELDPTYCGRAVIFDPSRVFNTISSGTHRPEGVFIGYNLDTSVLEGSDDLSTTDIVPIVLRILQSRPVVKADSKRADV